MPTARWGAYLFPESYGIVTSSANSSVVRVTGSRLWINSSGLVQTGGGAPAPMQKEELKAQAALQPGVGTDHRQSPFCISSQMQLVCERGANRQSQAQAKHGQEIFLH